MKAQVMKSAWDAARKAAAIFGGKASQYLSSCLKSAWAQAKVQASMSRLNAFFSKVEAKKEVVKEEVKTLDNTAFMNALSTMPKRTRKARKSTYKAHWSQVHARSEMWRNIALR